MIRDLPAEFANVTSPNELSCNLKSGAASPAFNAAPARSTGLPFNVTAALRISAIIILRLAGSISECPAPEVWRVNSELQAASLLCTLGLSAEMSLSTSCPLRPSSGNGLEENPAYRDNFGDVSSWRGN